MSREEAAQLLGEPADQPSSPLLQRRVFLQLPLEERRRILAAQAQALHDDYADDLDRDLWQGGDFLNDDT